MKDKYIVLIVGESGSGKSTICDELTKRYGLKQVKSYTTRPRRSEDEDGHTFINDEQFDNLEDICAYTLFDGHRYCATKEQIDNSDLYIIDPKGIEYFMAHYNGRKIPMVVYIHAVDWNRKKRMIERGDDIESVNRRIKNDEIEFKDVEQYAALTHSNNVIKTIDIIVKNIYNQFFKE